MKVLVITDGTEVIDIIAKSIKKSLDNFKVQICPAGKFEGTDLLPADAFILGCENPSPASFSYLEEMLEHINLAARKCGVYSVKEKTLKYLRSIIKDCDAEAAEPLLVKDGKVKSGDLKKWLKGTLK